MTDQQRSEAVPQSIVKAKEIWDREQSLTAANPAALIDEIERLREEIRACAKSLPTYIETTNETDNDCASLALSCVRAKEQITTLQAELADFKKGAQAEADAGDEARAELAALKKPTTEK